MKSAPAPHKCGEPATVPYMASKGEAQEGTNRTVWLISGAMAVSGGVLLWISGISQLRESPQWVAFIGQLGGLLVATGLVTFGWEQWGRRQFARELLAMANLRKDLTDSGVQRIGNWHDLDSNLWPELFLDVTELDIVLAYSLQSSHRVRIEAAERRGVKIRAFLPDPEDSLTMEALARRFQMTPAQLQTRVREAMADLTAIANLTPDSKMRVFTRPGDLVYSGFRFNSRAVLTLYSHSKERQSYVPTLVVKGGDLLAFLLRDLNSMESQGRLVTERQEQHRGHDG